MRDQAHVLIMGKSKCNQIDSNFSLSTGFDSVF